jgi:mRNA interferase YafQ
MLDITYTPRFLKDMKRAKRRNLPENELYDVVRLLSEDKQLLPKYHDHALQGNWAGYRECHIRPDWLLIYKIERHILTLVLTRTGTHSDLF